MTGKETEIILRILEQTKDRETITDLANLDRNFVLSLGSFKNTDGTYRLERGKRIDLAMMAVEQGADIAEVVKLMTWKDFERLVAGILVENDFLCTESFRRRGTSIVKGMEIDVIGIRGRLGISVDAKMWSIRGSKVAALRTAAEKQKERTFKLATQLDRLLQKITIMKEGKYEFIPIIVTWLVEEVEMHEGVPIVPVFKFNSFILNFEQYQDLMVSYAGYL
ncbi:hypothetical protein EU527_11895 [Candidatus Thorarchaeota archaeon]|nr:MAG: hypothetical protein EU527_11895 [Candidatus Thorarchaeota archaeon]